MCVCVCEGGGGVTTPPRPQHTHTDITLSPQKTLVTNTSNMADKSESLVDTLTIEDSHLLRPFSV